MGQSNKAIMEKDVSPGLRVTSLTHGACSELFITAELSGFDTADDMFRRVHEYIDERDAKVLSQEVFGLPGVSGDPGCPMTWIETGKGTGLAGTQVWAVSGVTVDTIVRHGKVVGTVFENEMGRYCRLGGIPFDDAGGDRETQARATFETMDELLNGIGMDFSRVVRTWFFNDMILEWYGEFNAVRDAFFRKHGLFEGVVPASTGVGGRNTAGSALSGGLIAVMPHDDRVTVAAVASPLQCPALDYGSSFNRAVEVATPDFRRLFVSGTASIEPEGETAHLENIEGQINLTLDVVAAILESRGMTWRDTVRGIAYVRRPEDSEAYVRLAAARDMSALPILVTENFICRDNLLFEIEIDAVVLT